MNLDSLKQREGGISKSFLFEVNWKPFFDILKLTSKLYFWNFSFKIVSNPRNGIDVDKFDYIARDCTHLSMANSFNYKRYIYQTRVIKRENGLNQICVRDKVISKNLKFKVKKQILKLTFNNEGG